MKEIHLNKWEVIEIKDALLERHEAYLEEEEWFEVEAHHSEEEAFVKITLRNADESLFYPAECRLELEPNEITDRLEALHLAMDFLDLYFSRYLREDRDLFLPIDWGSFEMEGARLWARGQIFNRKLENLADRWMRGELTEEDVKRLTQKEEKKEPLN